MQQRACLLIYLWLRRDFIYERKFCLWNMGVGNGALFLSWELSIVFDLLIFFWTCSLESICITRLDEQIQRKLDLWKISSLFGEGVSLPLNGKFLHKGWITFDNALFWKMEWPVNGDLSRKREETFHILWNLWCWPSKIWSFLLLFSISLDYCYPHLLNLQHLFLMFPESWMCCSCMKDICRPMNVLDFDFSKALEVLACVLNFSGLFYPHFRTLYVSS